MNLHRATVMPEGRTLLVVFAVLFGLLAALIRGYGYGIADQEVHIPEILRILDSSYLANDFSLNSASNFGPRFYYSHAVASMTRCVPLEAIFAVLYLIQSVSTACITALAARDITGSTITAMIAVVLVMSLIPFSFGNVASVLWFTVIPSYLALALALFALWMAISDRTAYATAAVLPAILIHPMVGLQGAVIALAALTARRIFLMLTQEGNADSMTRLFAPLVLASAIISAETILFWVLPAIRTGAILSLETEEFVRIIAHYRHPGNLVPSTWPIRDYLLMGMFTFVVLTAFVSFWRRGSKAVEPREHRARQVAVATIFITIMVAFLAGYVLVEIIPTRVVAQAYVFRLVPVFVWLGWIIVARSIADDLVRGVWSQSVPTMVSTLHPVTMFLYKLVAMTDKWTHRSRPCTTRPQSAILLVALLALLIVSGTLASAVLDNPVRAAISLLVIPGFLLITVIVARPRFVQVSLMALGSLLLLTTVVFTLDRLDILPEMRLPDGSPLPEKFENIPIVAYFQPILSTEESMVSPRCNCDELATLAAVARRETDPYAVFLIPSNWRSWRMFSRRAIVVDGKFMPFRDEGMLEWYKRHLDIYDSDLGVGYPENVTEPELLSLRDRYGFDYAVLPIHTDTQLPVVSRRVV